MNEWMAAGGLCQDKLVVYLKLSPPFPHRKIEVLVIYSKSVYQAKEWAVIAANMKFYDTQAVRFTGFIAEAVG